MTSNSRDIVVVLPSIRSTHNTGSFFRTGDAVGVTKIVMCGITATPPHPHLLKVSLGAEESVPWEYIEDPLVAIQQLRKNGYTIIGVEQTDTSTDYRTAEYPDKVAVLFGHEVDGLALELQQECDLLVELPMNGMKESLNVSVAGGVILYHLLRAATPKT